jgi:hypothetical protein
MDDRHDFISHRNDEIAQGGPNNLSPPHGFTLGLKMDVHFFAARSVDN